MDDVEFINPFDSDDDIFTDKPLETGSTSEYNWDSLEEDISKTSLAANPDIMKRSFYMASSAVHDIVENGIFSVSPDIVATNQVDMVLPMLKEHFGEEYVNVQMEIAAIDRCLSFIDAEIKNKAIRESLMDIFKGVINNPSSSFIEDVYATAGKNHIYRSMDITGRYLDKMKEKMTARKEELLSKDVSAAPKTSQAVKVASVREKIQDRASKVKSGVIGWVEEKIAEAK